MIECKDCKLRNGDCGYHFKGLGYTNYDIPSLSACDRYGNCEFFQQKEILQDEWYIDELCRLRSDLKTGLHVGSTLRTQKQIDMFVEALNKVISENKGGVE